MIAISTLIFILTLLIPIALASDGETMLSEAPNWTVTSGEAVDHPKVPTPEDRLLMYSNMYGADYQLSHAIITCESGWVRTAKNPGSSAYGYWQFIDSTWVSTMRRMGYPTDTPKDDPVIAIEAGAWLLAEDGARHWLESKPCWSNIIR